MVISMFLSKNFNKFESERLEEELGHAIALFSQTKNFVPHCGCTPVTYWGVVLGETTCTYSRREKLGT